MYIPTTAVKKLSKLTKRIHGIQGGTAASKTISILQLLIDKAQRDESPQLTSVTAESMPHLKRGAMRDFKDIMLQQGYWNPSRWNATDKIYTFETGTPMEFFSLDMPHKVRGPRRKRLFINEANNIPYETFDQLEIRTEEVIWLDWNPVSEFWWHVGEDDIYDAVSEREDADSIILTYKDNEGLSNAIRKSIESKQHLANWWRVYGLGLIGEIESRIYKDWKIIDEIPHEARLERYGMDFGYTNDPTAIVAIYKYNGGIILDEIAYKKGLLNSQIISILKNNKSAIVVADSAEPKSIDEISLNGIMCIPSKKGPGSVNQGIDAVQNQRISVTKKSINLIKEYRNYLWEDDKIGKTTNIPSPVFNHMMDAVRYGIASIILVDRRTNRQSNRPRLTYGRRK